MDKNTEKTGNILWTVISIFNQKIKLQILFVKKSVHTTFFYKVSH